jgi:uncharacterized protein (DUF1501 family)
MVLTRRRFLQIGGLGLLATAGSSLWLDPRGARAASRSGTPLLVTLFLRGAADGLHLVPPIGDPHYARARGALALAKPLPFADGFGLHPALAALQPLVRQGELAAVQAVGSDDRSRSHFEAQDRMELADPERRGGGDGWLARALDTQTEQDPFATLALANSLPLSLEGAGAFAIGDPARFGLEGASPGARRALVSRYDAAGADPVAAAGRRALGALAEYERRTGLASPTGSTLSDRPGRGGGRRADPPLPERVRQLLALEAAGLPIRAVALECHGWDTHQRQGSEIGAMVRPMQELANGLAGLASGLRGRRQWLAVVMTEFGRTVRPNGSQGTDHGHASVMLIAGSLVEAGVHGPWPGLADDALYEGRDLAVATDYRDVLHEVLTAHLGAPPPANTFPGLDARALGVIG